jgi:nicotinate-nucleotide adenylyltransferase
MSSEGIALFGGSFNPIHCGHLIAARAVAEHLGLSRVILIPAGVPPHKRPRDLADARDRLEMARLAVEGEAVFEVSDFELRQEGLNYSIRTVEAFRQMLGPDVHLHWIIGADTLLELHTWYRTRELVDLCRMVTAVRPGYDTPDLSQLLTVLSPQQVQCLKDRIVPTPRIDISASSIRARIRAGRSIRYLTPDAVREYIESRGLYRGAQQAASPNSLI